MGKNGRSSTFGHIGGSFFFILDASNKNGKISMGFSQGF